MPRPPRVHVAGGHYHVTLRGNHRESLYGSGADRDTLTDIVREAIAKYSARVHAYCWMTNHLHLLIQIGEQRLGKIMQRIASRYARYRHRQLFQTGHLFERRYWSNLVELDSYFVQLLRYIHLNPVEAGLVHDPAAHRWSSHTAYLGTDLEPWVTTEFGLSLFGTNPESAQAAYRAFIDESLRCRTPEGHTPTLTELARKISAKHGVTVDALRSPARNQWLARARAEFVASAIDERIDTVKGVAAYLNRNPSTLVPDT